MHLCHRLVTGLLLLLISLPLLAMEHAEDERLARLARESGPSLASSRVTLWYPARLFTTSEAQAFLDQLDTALKEIEQRLQRPLDRAHYGEQAIEVFLSPQAGVSHVYGSYQQPRYDKPWIFLLPRMVKDQRSPYSHEMTHLVAWRFQAHSLREGLACWMQVTLAQAGKGLNTPVHGFTNRAEADRLSADALRGSAGPALLAAMGSDGLPERNLTAPGGQERSDYYALSYSFVAFLIERLGLADFMKLYEAPSLRDPAALAGVDIAQLRQQWLTHLGLAP